jgi:hypothetical protein
MARGKRSKQRFIAITIELSKEYKWKKTFIWINKRINGCQKYRKITKNLFEFYRHEEE